MGTTVQDTFAFRIYSQEDWTLPERVRILVDLLQWDFLGKRTEYRCR